MHALNRFTFGPRPGDLAEVMHMGTDAWFEQQLNPGSIPDADVQKRLADFPALQLSPPQLVESFPTQQVIRQVADGKRPMPQDATLAAVYEVLIAKYERKRKEQSAGQDATDVAQANATTGPQGVMATSASSLEPAGKKPKKDPAAAGLLAEQIFALPKEQRMPAILKLPVDDRIVLTGSLGDPLKSHCSPTSLRVNANCSPRWLALPMPRM